MDIYLNLHIHSKTNSFELQISTQVAHRSVDELVGLPVILPASLGRAPRTAAQHRIENVGNRTEFSHRLPSKIGKHKQCGNGGETDGLERSAKYLPPCRPQ